MRGDNLTGNRQIDRAEGPPPRAWGQLVNRLSFGLAHRSTPTCVGTTSPGPTAIRRCEVHPHVRGDNKILPCLNRFPQGPPPRAWGQRLPPYAKLLQDRSTPTCVGTTTSGSSSAAQWTGPPPRAWGQQVSCANRGPASGPPPRAWGQPFWGWLMNNKGRSTPTCVGTTIAQPQPHSDAVGPPPRAWGQRQAPSARTRGRAVHPHVRGDNPTTPAARPRRGGPPPRAWGQLISIFFSVAALRSTPTCVGTTSIFGSSKISATVHPHVRGDN